MSSGPADESRRQADRNPDEHDDRHRNEADDERDASAVDETTEDVAAIAIGAEWITPVAGRLGIVRLDPGRLPVLAGGAKIALHGIVRGDGRGEDGDDGKEDQAGHPDHRQLVSPELAPGVRPEAARRAQGAKCSGQRFRGGHSARG